MRCKKITLHTKLWKWKEKEIHYNWLPLVVCLTLCCLPLVASTKALCSIQPWVDAITLNEPAIPIFFPQNAFFREIERLSQKIDGFSFQLKLSIFQVSKGRKQLVLLLDKKKFFMTWKKDKSPFLWLFHFFGPFHQKNKKKRLKIIKNIENVVWKY